MEQEISVFETKGKKGDVFKNISLRTKVDKSTGKVIQGLTAGNHIVIEKVFAEGYENKSQYGTSYSCKAKYGDEEVSFWLNSEEHGVYKDVGGEGDKLMISAVSVPYKYKGDDKVKLGFEFKIVED